MLLRKTPKPDAAFDVWLQRGLHKMFDDVASEPIPEELLRLIEDDRKKLEGSGKQPTEDTGTGE
ncbi:MAG: hypothetical protein JO264_03950 [Acidisphaera sp.]|nr:hypothetical protein [Acidisphaera sp.]